MRKPLRRKRSEEPASSDEDAFRIGLVSPRLPVIPTFFQLSACEPLGLEYIAGYLRSQEFDVCLFDQQIQNLTDVELTKLLLDFRPHLLGFGVGVGNLPVVLKVSKVLKKRFPVKIALGGPNASLFANDVMKRFDFIDFVVYGEGELPFYNLAECLRYNKPIENLTNVFFRKKDGVFFEKSASSVNPDTYPWPSRDSLDHLLEKNLSVVPLVLSSRGCNGVCKFCTTGTTNCGSWRPREPERVVEEISKVVQEYRTQHFSFADDNVLGTNPTNFERICELLIDDEVRASFGISCRADRALFKKGLAEKMRKAGLISACIGVETGDHSTLLKYRKGVSRSHCKRAFELLGREGVFVRPGFIMFEPESTVSSLTANLNILKELGVAWKADVFYRRYVAFRGTPYFRELDEKGLIRQKKQFDYPYAYRFLDSFIEQRRKFAAELSADVYFPSEFMTSAVSHLSYLSLVAEWTNHSEATKQLSQVRRAVERVFRKTAALNCAFFEDIFCSEANYSARKFKNKKTSYLTEFYARAKEVSSMVGFTFAINPNNYHTQARPRPWLGGRHKVLFDSNRLQLIC